MLSRIPTKQSYKKGIDPAKKKILFVLALIFVGVVLYGLSNLSKIKPDNAKKIPIVLETGDKPVEKKIMIIVNSEGQPLNIRENHNEKAAKIGQIPDKTVIEAEEELEGWYKITYNGKQGWISKKYTLLQSDVVATEDKTAQWPAFKGTGYTFKYPKNWYNQNYSNDSLVWIAFSNTELPAEAPKGSVIPIELKVYGQIQKPAGGFRADSSTKKEAVKVAGVDAVKYTYVSPETSTEINVFEFESAGSYFSFAENGGYLEDLTKILETFKFS